MAPSAGKGNKGLVIEPVSASAYHPLAHEYEKQVKEMDIWMDSSNMILSIS